MYAPFGQIEECTVLREQNGQSKGKLLHAEIRKMYGWTQWNNFEKCSRLYTWRGELSFLSRPLLFGGRPHRRRNRYYPKHLWYPMCFLSKTRKHSSRMRTACLLIGGGGVLSGCAAKRCFPRVLVLFRGWCPGGISLSGGAVQTNASKKYYLAPNVVCGRLKRKTQRKYSWGNLKWYFRLPSLLCVIVIEAVKIFDRKIKIECRKFSQNCQSFQWQWIFDGQMFPHSRYGKIYDGNFVEIINICRALL